MEIDKEIRNEVLISDTDNDINHGRRTERQAWVVPPSAARGWPSWSSAVKGKGPAILSSLAENLVG